MLGSAAEKSKADDHIPTGRTAVQTEEIQTTAALDKAYFHAHFCKQCLYMLLVMTMSFVDFASKRSVA